MTPQFDVFISYNTKDREFVMQVVEKLKERGLKAWIDEEEIPPSVPSDEAISAGLRDSGAIAVFIGPNDVGRWQRPEINAAVNLRVARNIPLITVLLPGVPVTVMEDLSVFLGTGRPVVFQKGAGDEKGFYDLEWIITGKKPPKPGDAPPPAPPDAVEDALDILADLLRTQNVTFFLGPGASFGAEPLPMQAYQIARDLLGELGIDGAASSELLPPVDVAGMYYAIKAGDPSLDSWITTQVGSTTRVFPAAHERLASLLKVLAGRQAPRSGGREPQLVVTTNFDLIMERSLLRCGLAFTRVVQHRSGQQVVVNRYAGMELTPDGTIQLPPETEGGIPLRARPDNFEELDLLISNYGQTTHGRDEVKSGGLALPKTPAVILYKFLGSQDVPNSCVMSTRHHFEFSRTMIQNNPIPPLITSIISNSTRLFIGLWLMDRDFRLTYYTLLRDAFRTQNDKRYALQLAPHHFAADVYRRMESRLWDSIKDEGQTEMGVKTLEVPAADFLARLDARVRQVLR